MPVGGNQLRQTRAHILARFLTAGTLLGQTRRSQYAVSQKRPHPERLPTQRHIPLIIEFGSLKLLAADFNLRVVKKAFHPPSLLIPAGLRFGQRPPHKISSDAPQRLPSGFSNLPEPLSQRCLVGKFLDAQQRFERLVLIQTFGIGQGGPSTGKIHHQLRQDHFRVEPFGSLQPWVKRLLRSNPAPQIKLIEQSHRR